MKRACKYGHLEVVKYLLSLSVHVGMNYIFLASDTGNAELIRLLLKDGRADPCFFNHYVSVVACKNGYLEVVNVLLEDPRVQWDKHRSHVMIVVATKHNHLDIIIRLINSGQIDLYILVKNSKGALLLRNSSKFP